MADEEKGIVERAVDWAKEKTGLGPALEAADKLNPVTAIKTATATLESANKQANNPQAQYEAREKAANRNNPSYPGNVPTQNVDESVTKKPF